MRQFVVYGECLVKVRFGDHVSGQPFTTAISTTTSSDPIAQDLVNLWGQLNGDQQIAVAGQIAASLGMLSSILVVTAFFDSPSLQSFIDDNPGSYQVIVRALNAQPVVFTGTSVSHVCELGLSSEQIIVTPRLYHQDIHVDDYGPQVPAEVLGMMAECDVRIDFIHYDPAVLEMCLAEAAGGAYSPASSGYSMYSPTGTFSGFLFAHGQVPAQSGMAIGVPYAGGFMAAGQAGIAGRPLGNGLPLMSSGNHYISLNVLSPKMGLPYRFRSCYLTDKVTIPVGSEASIVTTHWRAIPYAPLYGAVSQTPSNTQVLEPASASGTVRSGLAPWPGLPGVVTPGRVYDHQVDV